MILTEYYIAQNVVNMILYQNIYMYHIYFQIVYPFHNLFHFLVTENLSRNVIQYSLNNHNLFLLCQNLLKNYSNFSKANLLVIRWNRIQNSLKLEEANNRPFLLEFTLLDTDFINCCIQITSLQHFIPMNYYFYINSFRLL